MVRRCHDPRTKQWGDYGGRGIEVCERWRSDFWEFYDDMGPRPEGAMLDRVDNDSGYSRSNCRWVDALESSANRRWCIRMHLDGEIVPLKAYMRHHGYTANDYRMVTKRVKRGMRVLAALTLPRKGAQS